MASATYVCTALNGSSKQGILKPDSEGYYTVVLGALDVFNSAGAYYPLNGGKHVFESSSTLMRRINNGALKGEWGHPKKQVGQSMRDFVTRVLSLDEDQISHHIKEVKLDDTVVKDDDNKPVMAVIGKVKPSGPKGQFLKEAFEDPNQDVCFSIRSLTNDRMVNGVTHKHLSTVVTWDYVIEPGIEYAKRWNAPSLESIETELSISKEQFCNIEKEWDEAGIAMESGKNVTIKDIFKDFGWSNKSPKLKSLGW